LKRLHAEPDKLKRKDACRPHGRLIAKIAAGNPLQVLETMVQQVSDQRKTSGQEASCPDVNWFQ
jgi:hypothetical protein